MYKLPDASNAICWGEFNEAAVAAILSLVYPALPLPAIVEIIPLVFILRTRLLLASDTYKLPDASRITYVGPLNSADVAWPPSPEKPLLPVPAMVEMIPLVVTLRIRLLLWSAIYI